MLKETYNGYRVNNRVTIKGAGDEPTVYTITKLIDRFLVMLEYEAGDGSMVGGGMMDASRLVPVLTER